MSGIEHLIHQQIKHSQQRTKLRKNLSLRTKIQPSIIHQIMGNRAPTNEMMMIIGIIETFQMKATAIATGTGSLRAGAIEPHREGKLTDHIQIHITIMEIKNKFCAVSPPRVSFDDEGQKDHAFYLRLPSLPDLSSP